MAKDTVTAETAAPARKVRKPRDPNAVRVERPVFVVFSLDRDVQTDKDAVSLHVATRNAAEAIEALEGHPGATYKKVLVKGARTAA